MRSKYNFYSMETTLSFSNPVSYELTKGEWKSTILGDLGARVIKKLRKRVAMYDPDYWLKDKDIKLYILTKKWYNLRAWVL